MLLIYSIFISIWDNSKKMFFLPILSYYSYDDTLKTTFTYLFGPFLFYSANDKDQKYFHILPIFFQRYWNKDEVLQTIFPFYWKLKLKEKYISTVLPVYWYYKSATFYLHHFIPIFGYVEETKTDNEKSYSQWSILYPFFRYNKYKVRDHYELHLFWPFIKIKKDNDYRSLRILPILWIRKYKTGKSGFVLFGYYKHYDDGNRIYTFWGLAGILHFKWEEKQGIERSITYFLLLYFHRKVPTYEFRYITPFFISYYGKEEEGSKDYNLIAKFITPFYYYWKSENYENLVIPFFYFDIQDIKKDSRTISYLLIYYRYETKEYIYRFIIPIFYQSEVNNAVLKYKSLLFGPYYCLWYGKDYVLHVFFPFIFYERENYLNTVKHLKSRLFIFPFYYHRINDMLKEKTFFILLFYYYIIEDTIQQVVHIKRYIRIYPLFYYSKIGDNYSLLIIPLYYHYITSIDSVYSIFIIFYYYIHYQENPKKFYKTIVLFPIFYYNSYDTISYLIILPFYYHRIDDQIRKTFSIFWIFYLNMNVNPQKSVDTPYFLLIVFPFVYLNFTSNQVFTLVVCFIYYEDRTKDTLYLFLLPIIKYWNDKTKDEVNILSLFTGYYYRLKEYYFIRTLIYYREIKEDEDTFFLLLYYRYYKKDLSYYNSIFIPIYYFEDYTDKEKTIYVLPFYYYHKKENDFTHYIIIYYTKETKDIYRFIVFPFFFNIKDLKNGTERFVIPLFYVNCKEINYKWKTICFIWYNYEEETIHFRSFFPFYFSYIKYFEKNKIKEPEENDILLEKKHKEFEYTLIIIYSSYEHKFEEGKQPDYFKIIFPIIFAKKDGDNTWRLLPLFLLFFQLGKNPMFVFFPFFFYIDTDNFNFLYFWFYGTFNRKDNSTIFKAYLFILYITLYYKTKDENQQDQETWIYLIGFILATRNYYISHNSSEISSFIFLLFYYFKGFYTKEEQVSKKEHLFIIPLLTYYDFRYDENDRKKTIFSPLFIYYQNLKGTFIMNILFTFYYFEGVKVVISWIYFSYEKNETHFKFYRISLLFFGLLGREEDYIEKNQKSLWILCAFIYSENNFGYIIISFPFIWYFNDKSSKTLVVFPFLISRGRVEGETLKSYYVLPLLLSIFRIERDVDENEGIKQNNLFSKISKIETFSFLFLYIFYSRKDNEIDIRILFILEYCVFRYVIERTRNINRAHYCFTKIYLLFIFYFKKQEMMSMVAKNYSDNSNHHDTPNFLKENYSSDSIEKYFYFLWLFERFSIFTYEKEEKTTLHWLVPFYYKYSYHEENKLKDYTYVLWIIDPTYSIFGKTHFVTNINGIIHIETHSDMYMILSRSYIQNDNMISHSISVFYIFHPFLSLFKYKKTNDLVDQVERKLIYLMPLFLKYNVETQRHKVEYLFIFWVFWKYLSLFGRILRTNKTTQITNKVLYIATLYYQSKYSTYFVIKIFFIPIDNDFLGLSLFYYCSENDENNPYHTLRIFIPILFYYFKTTKDKIHLTMYYMNWIWIDDNHQWALLGYKHELNTSKHDHEYKNYYIYPLFIKIFQKKVNERKNSLSLFYTTKRWFALFFYMKNESKNIQGEMVEIELKEVDETEDQNLYSNGKIEYICYLYQIFDYRYTQINKKMLKLQIYGFYFIYRQLGFFQFWNIAENFEGFYLLPFIYSYEFSKGEKGISIFWITRYIAGLHYRITPDGKKDMYMLLTFYEDSDKMNYRLYLLWFFNKKVSIMEYWNVNEFNEKSKGLYIFILFLMYEKYESDSNKFKEYVFCMFWLATHWISLIHYSNINDHKITYLGFTLLIEKFKDYSSVHLFWIPKKLSPMIQTASLIKYIDSKLDNEIYYLVYAFPLFMKLEKKDHNEDIKLLAIFWLFHSNLSIFLNYSENYLVEEKPLERKYMYLFITFYKEEFLDNNQLIEYNLFIFWFLHKKVSIIQRWIDNKTNETGFLIFILFRYSFKDNITRVSMFWIIKAYIGFFYFYNHKGVEKKSTLIFFYYFYSNTKDEKFQLYLFWFFYKTLALIEYWSYKDHFGYYSFLIAKYESFENKKYLCLFWIYKQYTLFFYEKDKENIYTYFYLIFYYQFSNNQSGDYESEFYLIYLFTTKLSWLGKNYSKTPDYYHKNLRILLLFRWFSSELPNGDKESYLAILYFIHQKISIFYHSFKQTKEFKETLTYLFFIFNKEWNSDGLYKIAVFWFIVRQASFIRFSFEKQDVKILFFPFFKYQRVRGQFSQWCLFPLIPVKYSFQASILLYKKKVIQKGIEKEDGIEDKTSRKQFTRVRFLYAIFVYTLDENDKKTIEFNPIYYSQYDPEYKTNTWRIFGGLFGQEEYLSTRKDKKRRDCRLFCCCNIPMAEEVLT